MLALPAQGTGMRSALRSPSPESLLSPGLIVIKTGASVPKTWGSGCPVRVLGSSSSGLAEEGEGV